MRRGFAALLAAALLVSGATPASASRPRSAAHREAIRLRDRYLDDRNALMVTLGLWASASIASGLALWTGAGDDEQQRAMGIQAAAWGAVNLGLAGVAIVRTPLQRRRIRTAEHWREQRRSLAFTFLWNAGLDVLYVTAGILLRTLGQAPWVRGTGNGVLVQGGWLLVFDSASWLFTGSS